MNKIKVLDENNNMLECDIIKVIENKELNKVYVAYKYKEDILVSQLIKTNDKYEILPVEDSEWEFIEKKLNE